MANPPRVKDRELRWTKRQRALLDHMVQQGGSVEAAGQAVGLSKTAAYRAYQSSEFRRELLGRIRDELPRLGADALRRMVRLASEAESEYVAFHANRDLLDRAAVSQQHVVGSGAVTLTINLLPVTGAPVGAPGGMTVDGSCRVVMPEGEPPAD